MKASYELTAEDLAAFIQFHHAQSPTVRGQRVGCLIKAFLGMLLLPGLILLTSKQSFLHTARAIWPLLLGPLLFLLTAMPYMKWRTGNLAKRILSEGQNAGFYGKCSLSLEADGLRESKTSGDTVRNWASVQKIVASGPYLFLYTSGVESFVVPRRAFDTDDEFNAFIQQVAQMSGVSVQRA